MPDLFDDPAQNEAPAEAQAAPRKPPREPLPPLRLQEYEAQCAASRELSVPDFRSWLRASGYRIAACPRGCLPFCRGWHLEDIGGRG